MANLHRNPRGFVQVINGDQIYPVGAQGTRIKFFLTTDHNLSLVAVDLNHVKRRSRGYAQALALAYGEIMNTAVLAYYFPTRGHQLAGGIGQGLTLVGKVGIEEFLVVAAGDKADLLRVRLFRQRQTVVSRQIAHCRLGHFSKWKNGPAELLLRQTEQEISLVFGSIGR